MLRIVIFLLLPLVFFFVYATTFNSSFFIFIGITLILIISYLGLLRARIWKKHSMSHVWVQNCQEQMNLLEVENSHESIAIKSFREKIVSFSQLKGLTEKLSMALSLEDTSKILSTEANRLFGDKRTTSILYLFHSRTGELGLSSSQKGQMRINIKSKKGDIFDQWIARMMQPLLIEDTKTDYRFDMDKLVTEDMRVIRSVISVPMMVGNKALGILRFDSPHENHFATEDLRFLTTIGNLGAVAIENAQLYERVEQLAIKDSLTNLYLKRYLLERMPEEINRQLRYESPMSFLMLDLDKFKQYNDNFGHIAGDIVLRTVSMMLINFFKKPGNLVCRYGGEEFCVLLPDCSKEQAMELAQDICRKIAKQTIILRREKTCVTISIGVATFPQDAQVTEDLIQKADQALYRAKKQGRNQVCV